jgi:hypothetical protein
MVHHASALSVNGVATKMVELKWESETEFRGISGKSDWQKLHQHLS